MTPLIFCSILAGYTITGAVEAQPGWMTVDYLDEHLTADYIVIPMDAYLECYPNYAAGLTPLEE
tara:strand:+ start:152 stop:343 length:192 start_codon:yes stop_codon:yes gene_type:complete